MTDARSAGTPACAGIELVSDALHLFSYSSATYFRLGQLVKSLNTKVAVIYGSPIIFNASQVILQSHTFMYPGET